jgi:hypothetical protein
MFESDEYAVDVVLEGGPAGLPRQFRLEPDAVAQDRIKVAHRGGYEHFELVGATATPDAGAPEVERPGTGKPPLVYRWSMRTRIAE